MTVNTVPTSLQLLGVVLDAFDMTRQSYTPAYERLNTRHARRARQGRRVVDVCDQWGAAAALLFGVPRALCKDTKASSDPLIVGPLVPIPPCSVGYSLHLHGIAWDRAREIIPSDQLRRACFRFAVVHVACLAAFWGSAGVHDEPVSEVLKQSPIRRALVAVREGERTWAGVANCLDVSEETVRRWRVGDAYPNSKRLKKLAALLKRDPETLHRQVGLWRLAQHLRRAIDEDEFEDGLRVFNEVRRCRAAQLVTGESPLERWALWQFVVPLWTWFVPEELLPREARVHGGPEWETDVRRMQLTMREGVRTHGFECVADLDAIHLEHVAKKRRDVTT